jgi:hypothetical protein
MPDMGSRQPDSLHHSLRVGLDRTRGGIYKVHRLDRRLDAGLATLDGVLREEVESSQESPSGGEAVESEHLGQEPQPTS